MDTPRAYWPIWMDVLRRQGLSDLVAWVLEAAGPFNILGAQALYFGQPFFSNTSSQGFRALADLLEKEDEVKAFTALLKGKLE